jgi:CDP-diacylglycerol--glycerol-3-phosphate 3-phosphatidyltransferase
LTLLPPFLRDLFLKLLDPVAAALIRAGITPNRITTLSIFVLLASGVTFGMGALHWGAGLLLLSGVFDILDGKVARTAGMSTRFGAFYDSNMDRFGEAVLFTGIGVYFMNTTGQRWPVLGLILCFSTLSGSFLVSYARARAEGLGLDCKVGIAQRAERIVGLGVPTLFFAAGPDGWLLLSILFVLAVMNAITVVQRILHVYNLTRDEVRQAAQAAAAHIPKGS